MDEMIGTEEAGKILGYTTGYMRQLCSDKDKRKRLGAKKFVRVWMFDKTKIEAIATKKKKEKFLIR